MEREVVENVLLSMGTPIRLKGFKYVVDSVLLLDKPEWANPKWTALYGCVGTLNNVNYSTVESAIRTVFRSTRDRNCDYDAINHYIGFDCDSSSSLMRLYLTIKKETKQQAEDSLRTMLLSLLQM